MKETNNIKPNYWPIIKDGLTLVIVSTLFVTMCNQLFSVFKKNSASDSLVTAILQNDEAGLKEILSEKEYKSQMASNSKAPLKSLEAYLLERTERVDDQGRTPLMWVAYSNVRDPKQHAEVAAKHALMLKTVIEAGANLNARDKDGWTALMWSSWSGLTEVAKILITSGADIAVADQKGNTALSLAVQKGNLEIVKLLLERQKTEIASSLENAKVIAERSILQHPDQLDTYKTILALITTSISAI